MTTDLLKENLPIDRLTKFILPYENSDFLSSCDRPQSVFSNHRENKVNNQPDIKLFRRLAERFSLIPLNGKIPFEKNWARYCLEKRVFKDADFLGCNAGVCTGPASNAVVIDEDDEHALKALLSANKFLIPETFTVKTGSNLHHYYFSCPQNAGELKNRSVKHPAFKNHTIFDVKGKGGQVVCPGSIHPDTKRPYVITKDKPLSPAPEWLENFMRRGDLNTDVLWEVPLPEPKRKKFIRSLKIPAEKKEMIIEGVKTGERSEAGYGVICSLLKAGYDEKNIFYVFDHFAIGLKYREKGGKRSKWLKGEIERAETFLNNTKSSGNNGPLVVNDFALRQKANEILNSQNPCSTFDVSDLPIPLRRYIEWICQTTDAPVIIAAQSVIATCSAFIGRRLFIAEEDYFQRLYPNIWACAIASSGSFKTTALNRGTGIARRKLMEIREEIESLESGLSSASDDEKSSIKAQIFELEKNNVFLPNRATAEGFLDHLNDGHAGMIVASEFGEWLENLEKSYIGALKPLLTDLYDVPLEYTYKTRTKKGIRVQEPFITINAVSNLSWVEKHIQIKDVSSGFFARFLLFYPPHEKKVPSALPLITQIDHTPENRIKEVLSALPFSKRYILSPESKVLFSRIHDELYTELYKQPDTTQTILEPFVKRWSPYVLKIALILQLFFDINTDQIGEPAILGAKSVIDYAIKSTTYLFKNELGESPHRRKCRKVLDYIAKNNGRVKRAKLQKSRVLEGGTAEYDYTCESLETSGDLVVDKSKQKKAEWEYILNCNTRGGGSD